MNKKNYNDIYFYYSVSTNFCLKLIKPSDREVFIFGTLVEREERTKSEERRKEHGSNLARLETAPDRLYKLKAKISGYDVSS